MVTAARDWLDSLDDTQRASAVLPWPSEEERHRWFYTPVDHGGLPLGRMTAAQQSLAMRLLASGLSEAGYVTASTIMSLENVLDQVEGWQVTRGARRRRDPQLYWVRVFGDPSADGPWAWRFGGHHVSVHHLVVDGEVAASSPCFLGADPAETPLLGGHLLRPLGAAEDLARDLVRSLDPAQLAGAVLTTVAPDDVVSRNQPRVRFSGADPLSLTAFPKGLPAAALTASQQDQLRAVLGVFLDRIPADLADREGAKFAGDRLHDVHFAWAGGVERGEPHYYRLQGPRLLAEYDNTQRDANHVHTVWRDPEGDFGDDVLRRHRAAHHSR
ncbi:DUF3500 domain-containing protein [Cryptosporangium sp. NPDC048952]|uniref:DUF3500 domain-containing protein n=1 Tax=Cryptosporangium sp. NPDC048952 TaxID=3363961 RepID=UPI003713A651